MSVTGPLPGFEERAVPGMTDLGNVCLHIARYNLALLHVAGKRVLDAACGVGYGTFLLSKVASQAKGVDCSPEALEFARLHYKSPTNDFIESDLLNLDLGEKFDVIISFETTEHLSDLVLWEEVLMRHLSAHGLFIFSVPLNEEVGFNPYHKHVFTLSAARALFPHLRLRDEAIQQGVNFYPVSPKQCEALRFLAYIGIKQKVE